MRTGIFTARDTQLMIETEEVADLVQMGREGAPTRLAKGKNTVAVSAGVFKLVTKVGVRVTAESLDLKVVVNPDNKGDWPDPGMARMVNADPKLQQAIVQFFADAKSEPAPE
jgi:hypothetical protein